MRIKLAENFRAVFYAPFYAAQALGFYAREGVDVELLDSSAPGHAATALYAGDIDLTWGGPMRVMKARDQDQDDPLICFAEVVRYDPFFLVGRRENFALPDLTKVKFASVSEVPTPWLCLQHDLRERGIDPDGISRVADRTMGENLTALESGDVDVIQVFEPYVSLALRAGAEILYAASSRGPTCYTTFLTTRASIARNRVAFEAMTRAVAHMQAWLAAHSGAELAAAVAPFYPQVAPDVLASGLTRYRKAGIWAGDVAVSPDGFARLANSLLSGGFIARQPRYEDCVDESFRGPAG